MNALLDHLTFLYGPAAGSEAFERLRARLAGWPAPQAGRGQLSEGDALVITYGDQVQAPGQPPLRVLAEFCRLHLAGVASGIHLLPFYPWTSDDGFSVTDYRAVDPALGDWDDLARLGRNFRLMVDGVINHISAGSEWFKKFLQDDPACRRRFIVVEGEPDLSQVVRPRALPLLTAFAAHSGVKQVWTTFSADQIDLNYADPEVLLEIVDVLLLYVARGAQFIRLDAIAYLWKEIGTPCIHLPQTHRVVQLLRAVLDAVAPQVSLITETNVPHADNVSYFGDGRNEAQLVYNFALPPLALHALRTGSAGALSDWAAALSLPSDEVTFFNFLASHDGIGLNPARGLLLPGEVDALVQGTLDRGGLISWKQNPDGTQSPYEMNINYYDALAGPPGEPPDVHLDRFMAAQAIMLALAGVPGVYFHSLFGSRGWPEGVNQSGRSRTINRQKCRLAELEEALADPASLRCRVYTRYRQLLAARASSAAFHPRGHQGILDSGPAVFGLRRSSPDGAKTALCLHNVSGVPQPVFLTRASLPAHPRDLISGQPVAPAGPEGLILQSYQALWLAEDPGLD